MSTKSASINDVQYSMNGQDNKESSNQFEHELSAIAKEDNISPPSEYVIYKLVDTKRNAPVNIDGIDDVINPQTGKIERIYLITGAPTIWSSDPRMSEILKDKAYVSQNRRSLRFEGKILRIPLWDEVANEFAKHCRHNIGSPNRKTGSKMEFFEYDPQKQAKAALDKELFEMDMAIKASQMPEESMMKHASFLGIQMIDELGRPKTPDGVRREYLLAAKRNPKLFERTCDSKEVEVAYMVKRAILDAKLDIGKENNTCYFANGGVVCKIPTNRKPLEYLTEFALTNSNEGREFLEGLKRIS